ncbi:MAG: T9SS type A sorting domain-containing protein [Bacteroidia bacterium]
MKTILILTISALSLLNAFALNGQQLVHKWSATFGDGPNDHDECQKILKDKNGNIYMAGKLEGAADFDPDTSEAILVADRNWQVYLAKYDTSKNLLWAFQFKTVGTSELIDVQLDKEGDIIVLGEFSQKIDLDPSPIKGRYLKADNVRNAFLAKYSSSGELMWGFKFDDKKDFRPSCLSIDSFNNVVVGGEFYNTVDFDPSTNSHLLKSNKYGDAFVAKYNPKGNFISVFSLESSLYSQALNIDFDQKNNLILNGWFSDTVDLDPTKGKAIHVASRGNFFVAKYTSSDSLIWVKKMERSGSVEFTDMYLTQNDGIILTGNLGSPNRAYIDFEPGTNNYKFNSSGRSNFFLAKYSKAGQLAFATAVIGQGEWSNEIEVDQDQNIYLAGSFYGETDFDPSSNSATFNAKNGPVFIAKYDSLGNYSDLLQIGETGYANATCITFNSPNDVWIGGAFSQGFDFDPDTNKLYKIPPTQYFTNSYAANYNLQNHAFKKAIAIVGREGDDDNVHELTHDSKGDLYAVGTFAGTIDFNPGTKRNMLRAKDEQDVFLAKYSSKGKLLWALNFGGKRWNTGNSITCDLEDNVIITGNFTDTIYPDPSDSSTYLINKSSLDVFIIKYSSKGELIWAKSFGGDKWQSASAVSCDLKNNIWVAGTFNSTVDFDPGPNTNNLSATTVDMFVSKFTKNGDYLFTKQIKDGKESTVSAIATDTNNSVYLTGFYKGSYDFNPGKGRFIRTKIYDYAPYLLKLDSIGKFKWAHTFDKSSKASITGLTIDNGNNVYVGGWYKDTLNIDSMGGFKTYLPKHKNNHDAFTASFKADGSFRWSNTIEGKVVISTPTTYGVSIAGIIDLTVSGDKLYTVGFFGSDSIDFDPSKKSKFLLHTQSRSAFTQVLDTQGSFINAVNVNGYFAENHCVDIKNEKIVIAGRYWDSLDLNHHPYNTKMAYSKGEDDFFLIQMELVDTCTVSQSKIAETRCAKYFTPSGIVLTKSGNYTDTILNSNYCDSIITIDLTINNTYDTLQVNACDSFISPLGNVYYKSGLFTEIYTNPKGCDSNITYNIKLGETKFRRINRNACSELISPSKKDTYRVSGNYIDTVKSANGCDSIIELSVYVGQPSMSKLSVASCTPVKSPSGKFIYSQTGIYNDTILNSQGCDSLIQVNYTRKFSSDTSLIIRTCKSLLSPSAKYTFTKSGIYTDTITNSKGCDSIITIDLTVYEPIDSFIQVLACDEYIAPSGKHTYTKGGIYKDTITSYKGCDSTIIIDLTIVSNKPSVSFSNNSLRIDLDSLSYQWLDCENDFVKIDTATRQEFRPTKSGEYTAVVYEESCADTAACLDVVIVGKEDIENNGISVYPNPANEVLFINSKFKVESLKVYSLEGKVLREAKNTNQINIEKLAPSIYFIEIETSSGVERFRFVKE